MSDVRILLSKNMKRGRDALGISQIQLAERVGCAVSYIGALEVGKKFPSAEMFSQIAEKLGFKPHQLLLEDLSEVNVAVAMLEIEQKLVADLADAAHDALVRYQALINK